MKIYDKKMFFQRIAGFVSGLTILLAMSIYFDWDISRILIYSIAPLITTFRTILISMSEEKLREENLKLQLNSVARQNLFGEKDKFLKWGWRILLVGCVTVLSYSLLWSVVLFALAVIYLFWYVDVIEREAQRLKEEMIIEDE